MVSVTPGVPAVAQAVAPAAACMGHVFCNTYGAGGRLWHHWHCSSSTAAGTGSGPAGCASGCKNGGTCSAAARTEVMNARGPVAHDPGPGVHRHLQAKTQCACPVGFGGAQCEIVTTAANHKRVPTGSPTAVLCVDDKVGLTTAYGAQVTCEVFKAMALCAAPGQTQYCKKTCKPRGANFHLCVDQQPRRQPRQHHCALTTRLENRAFVTPRCFDQSTRSAHRHVFDY